MHKDEKVSMLTPMMQNASMRMRGPKRKTLLSQSGSLHYADVRIKKFRRRMSSELFLLSS